MANKGFWHPGGRRRPSVFVEDKNGDRYQGAVTKQGALAFERARRRLGTIYRHRMGRSIGRVSDGDTIEFLARGEGATERYLEKLRQRT